MANWSDTHISFSGTIEAIEAFGKFLEEDNEVFPVYEREVDLYKETLTVDGQCRWGIDLNEVSNFCKTYKIEASGYDAESGSDFFTKFSIDKDGVISREDYDYLCKESVEAYGEQYFIEYYQESRDTAEEAENLYEELLEAGAIDESEDKWEYIQYFCWKKLPNENETALAKKNLEKLKGYNKAIGKERVLSLDDFYIVEVEKTDNQYKAMVKEKESGLWREEVLGLEVFKDIANAKTEMIEV